MEIVRNITNEAVQKYVKEQAEESRRHRFISEQVTVFVTLPFEASSNNASQKRHYQTTS